MGMFDFMDGPAGEVDPLTPSLGPRPATQSTSPWLRMFGGGVTPQAQEADRLIMREDAQTDLLAPLQEKALALRDQFPDMPPAQIMLKVIQSPEGTNAMHNMDAEELTKNLQTVLSSTMRPPPTLTPMAKGSTMLGTDEMGVTGVVGEGQGETTMTNQSGEPYATTTTPGRAYGTPQVTQPGTAGSGFLYQGENGEPSTTPPVKWSHTLDAAPPEFQPLYQAAAAKYGVPVELLVSQGAKETGEWDPAVVSGQRKSPKGAIGIGQFMPDMPAAWSAKWGTAPFDPLVPEQAIDAQAHVMSDLITKYNGNYKDALAAYNRGETKFDAWDKAGRDPAREPGETTQYTRAIMSDRSPLPQVANRPGQGAKAWMQAQPVGKPITERSMDPFLKDNPGFMFAGVGLLPALTEVMTEVGRQVDSSVNSESLSANHYARQRLRQLTGDLASLNSMVPARYKGPFEKLMAAMDPSSGGIINDPLDALDTAVYLRETLSSRAEELRSYNVTNTPKTLVDDYTKELRLTERVLDDIPSFDQMADAREYFVKGKGVMDGPTFFDNASSSIKGWVGKGTKQLDQELSSSASQPSSMQPPPLPNVLTTDLAKNTDLKVLKQWFTAHPGASVSPEIRTILNQRVQGGQ